VHVSLLSIPPNQFHCPPLKSTGPKQSPGYDKQDRGENPGQKNVRAIAHKTSMIGFNPLAIFWCALRVCLKAASPAASILKYLFARPPLSGVASPIQDETKPFSSRRSRAV